MIDAAVRDALERGVLCWLATADGAGRPNVSPKEVFLVEDERHLLVANIASPRTVRNLRENPAACVSLVDVFTQKGFKLSGEAELVERTDARFAALAEPLEAMAGAAFRVLAVIRLRVDAVEPILAPSYRFVPGTTEATQVAAAYRRYGVEARKDPA